MVHNKNIILFVNENMEAPLSIHIKEQISLQTFFKNVKNKSLFIDVKQNNIKILTEKDILENKELYITQEKSKFDDKKEKGEQKYFAQSSFQNSPKASELPIPDDSFLED